MIKPPPPLGGEGVLGVLVSYPLPWREGMKGRGKLNLFTLTPTLSPAYRQAGVEGEGFLRDSYACVPKRLSRNISPTEGTSACRHAPSGCSQRQIGITTQSLEGEGMLAFQ